MKKPAILPPVYTVADLVADLLKLPQDLPVVSTTAEESSSVCGAELIEDYLWWDWNSKSGESRREGRCVRIN